MGRRFELDGVEYEVESFFGGGSGGVFARKVDNKNYYINASGPRPLKGDVFRTFSGNVCVVLSSEMYAAVGYEYVMKLSDPPQYTKPRHLLVRDGERWGP